MKQLAGSSRIRGPAGKGLVVLSTGYEKQKRMLEDAEAQLWFGKQKLFWSDIWEGSYYVRLKNGNKPEVKRLPRYLYCDRNTKAY
jgi:hypothetical protein